MSLSFSRMTDPASLQAVRLRLRELSVRFNPAGAQGSGVAALLKRSENVLLVFNDRLYRLSDGSWRALEAITPDVLAAAAAQLLEIGSPRTSRRRFGPAGGEQPDGIVLLLPPKEFITTTVNMPGVARESIRQALQLQTTTLLPGYDEPLALAVNIKGHQADFSDVALWISQARVDALFSAFKKNDLFLVGVMPRILPAASALTREKVTGVIEDRDDSGICRVGWDQGVVRQWLRMSSLDLEDPVLAEQWHALNKQTLKDAPAGNEGLEQTLAGADDYLAALSPQDIPVDYAFYPAGAEKLAQQQRKTRHLAMAAAVLVGALMLTAVPFVLQAFEMRQLQSSLAQHAVLAAPARADQAAVRDFEFEWGVLTDYPRQDVETVLKTLESLILPGALTSLSLDAGYISIQGESRDPENLLQRLEQNSMFTEVDFSSVISNNRYTIDMRLTTVDFADYRARYFPERR